MKEGFSGVLAVLLLSIGLDLIHRHAPDSGIALAAESHDDLQPLITTSELIVGENRFAFGLAKANKLLENTAVQLRIYSIDGPEARLTAETNALYQPIGSAGSAERVHRHADGIKHVHRPDSDVRSLYVIRVAFGALVLGESRYKRERIMALRPISRLTVTVLDASQTPAQGSPVPRNLI